MGKKISRFKCHGNFKYLLIFISGVSLTMGSSVAQTTYTATTANTIQGNKPELIPDYVTDIDNGTFPFLLLTAKDESSAGNSYNNEQDAQFISKINGITDLGKKTLAEITANLADNPSGILTGQYSDLADGDAIDSDGDVNFYLDGTIKAAWYYKDSSGNAVEITDLSRTFCDLYMEEKTPFIQVSTLELKLKTQYGDPSENTYKNTTKVFNLPTAHKPFTCYALPNLGDSTNQNSDKSVWNAKYGFIPQNISVPASNFPGTGSHGLYFYLTLVGTSAQDVINSSTNLSNGNISLQLEVADKPNKLKVTLKGPRELDADKTFSASEFHLKSQLPDGCTTDVYTFNLRKWFVAKAQPGDT